MKTVKNSISMKALLLAVFAVSFAALANGQFQSGTETSQTLQEVRIGTTVTYSVPADGGLPHTAGDSYRWAVIGGTITGSIVAATVTTGDSSIVEFTVDNYQITVEWDTDIDPATDPLDFQDGQVLVQKLSATGTCPSGLQNLPVRRWNAPSASFADVATEICSGDGAAASVTVDFTGAPFDGIGTDGFTVNYTMTIPTGLDALDGLGDPFVATSLATTNEASVTIDLPATFINRTEGSLDFVLTLTTMTDDFGDSDGTVATGTYTITVYPVPETGEIESSVSLTRR